MIISIEYILNKQTKKERHFVLKAYCLPKLLAQQKDIHRTSWVVD